MRCISRRLMVCQEPCHARRCTRSWLEVGLTLVSVGFSLAGGSGTSRIYPPWLDTDHYSTIVEHSCTYVLVLWHVDIFLDGRGGTLCW